LEASSITNIFVSKNHDDALKSYGHCPSVFHGGSGRANSSGAILANRHWTDAVHTISRRLDEHHRISSACAHSGGAGYAVDRQETVEFRPDVHSRSTFNVQLK
jgi:hypothetical protein